jgi:cystathionine gamma-synthase/methionine-gamma-lyase
MTDLDALRAAVAQRPRAVVLAETISNPLLHVVDVPRLAEVAHKAGAQVVLDNTFAAPCRYAAAVEGVDWVVYSATKYHGGHGDAMAGLVAASQERCRSIREANKVVGSVLGPDDAWLILRGLKTLELRSRQQCANALAVAAFLASHPAVGRVHYPGLTSHPQFALARRLFPSNRCGAIVSFEIRGADKQGVFRFMDSLELVRPATSLGDVFSLLLYPAQSSHRSLSENQRLEMGVGPNLVRLSLGIEEPSDLIADLDQALRRAVMQ